MWFDLQQLALERNSPVDSRPPTHKSLFGFSNQFIEWLEPRVPGVAIEISIVCICFWSIALTAQQITAYHQMQGLWFLTTLALIAHSTVILIRPPPPPRLEDVDPLAVPFSNTAKLTFAYMFPMVFVILTSHNLAAHYIAAIPLCLVVMQFTRAPTGATTSDCVRCSLASCISYAHHFLVAFITTTRTTHNIIFLIIMPVLQWSQAFITVRLVQDQDKQNLQDVIVWAGCSVGVVHFSALFMLHDFGTTLLYFNWWILIAMMILRRMHLPIDLTNEIVHCVFWAAVVAIIAIESDTVHEAPWALFTVALYFIIVSNIIWFAYFPVPIMYVVSIKGIATVYKTNYARHYIAACFIVLVTRLHLTT